MAVRNMGAGIPLEEMISRLSPEQQAKVHARAQELIAEEMSLRSAAVGREDWLLRLD